MPAVLGAFEFPPVSHLFEWPELLFKDSPLAINKTVIYIALAAFLAIGFFALGSRKRALVPTGVQNLAETSYNLIEENIAVEVMGVDDGKHWTPFLASLFFYIFFMNIFEVIPGIQFPPTSRFGIPFFLALMVWLMMVIIGLKSQGVGGYFKNALFPPGVPKALYVLVTPIEFISTFIVRPFSHSVRLFANMMAGHILLTTFALLTAALWLGKWNAIFLPLPFFGGVAMTGFEILVALLQAYIFTILAAVYIAGSLHPEH
jgi:F-type H+-transporting ATPase subunit a